MDKLKEKVDERLKQVSEYEVNDQNIDFIGKLVDIEKDIAKIKHYEKEDENMRYSGYGEYGEGYGARRRRDSRGRYMEGNSNSGRGGSRGSYGHYMPDMYWGQMEDGYDRYMESKERYNRGGNYGDREEATESLDSLFEGMYGVVEYLREKMEGEEEVKIMNKWISKMARGM